MKEELLEWPVVEPIVEDLEKRVSELSQEVSLLYSTYAGIDSGDSIPNARYATKVANRLARAHEKYESVMPADSYAALVHEHCIHVLRTSEEFVRFFFTPNAYRKSSKPKRTVGDFLTTLFMSPDDPLAQPFGNRKKAGAINFFERLAHKTPYKLMEKQQGILREFEILPFDADPRFMEALWQGELPRIRSFIGDFAEAFEFVSPDERASLDALAKEREARYIELFKQQAGGLAIPLTGSNTPLDQRWDGDPRCRKRLITDITWGGENYSYSDWHNRYLELRSGLLSFRRDRRTGQIHVYPGLALITGAHEISHDGQGLLNEYATDSLTDKHGEFSPYVRVMTEGAPSYIETLAMRWLRPRASHYGIEDHLVPALLIDELPRQYNHLARLLFTIYKQEYFYDSNSKLEARRKLARIFNNEAFLDDDPLPQESLFDTVYYGTYFAGERYVQRTMEGLIKDETKRLGSRPDAKRFLEEHKGPLVQGLLTGAWGWHTYARFVREHYWPRYLQSIGEKPNRRHHEHHAQRP